MDYTRNFEFNKSPDSDIDFKNLKSLYGEFSTSRNLGLNLRKRNPRYTGEIRVNGQKGRLLYQSKRRKIYENDLGQGFKMLSSYLLTQTQ